MRVNKRQSLLFYSVARCYRRVEAFKFSRPEQFIVSKLSQRALKQTSFQQSRSKILHNPEDKLSHQRKTWLQTILTGLPLHNKMLAQALDPKPKVNLNSDHFISKLNFSHHRNKLFDTVTFNFLVYVSLLIWTTAFMCYCSISTLADSPLDNSEPTSGDERSGARQLYCQHCLSDCSAAAMIGGQQRIKPSLSSDQIKYLQGANIDQQSSSRTIYNLGCSCKSVFDTKKQAFTCKNISSAESELITRKNNNHTVVPHLKAKAFSRAETKTLAVNSMRMPTNS